MRKRKSNTAHKSQADLFFKLPEVPAIPAQPNTTAPVNNYWADGIKLQSCTIREQLCIDLKRMSEKLKLSANEVNH